MVSVRPRPRKGRHVTARMLALGQKQTCALHRPMSALPPKADMCGARVHVCFGPEADMGQAPCLLILETLIPPLRHADRSLMYLVVRRGPWHLLWNQHPPRLAHEERGQ